MRTFPIKIPQIQSLSDPCIPESIVESVANWTQTMIPQNRFLDMGTSLKGGQRGLLIFLQN